MKANELLENHPETSLVVREWFLKQMYKSFEDENVPEEMKDYMKQRGVTEEQLATYIDINPRMLLDVLDSLEVYIETIREDRKFFTIVNGAKSEYGYDDRKEVEKMAIAHAFTILEERLMSTKREPKTEQLKTPTDGESTDQGCTDIPGDPGQTE